MFGPGDGGGHLVPCAVSGLPVTPLTLEQLQLGGQLVIPVLQFLNTTQTSFDGSQLLHLQQTHIHSCVIIIDKKISPLGVNISHDSISNVMINTLLLLQCSCSTETLSNYGI